MTYEHVVVIVKATGGDPLTHIPVEVAWWDLATGDRGHFIPPHDPHEALRHCHLPTVKALGYLSRLADARQDTDGVEAGRLAQALHHAVLVTISPRADEQLLRRMYLHYLQDFEIDQRLGMPEWHGVLDAGAYAAGVLGLPTVPDLPMMCEYTGVARETVALAETDTDALGRSMLRLAELVEAGSRRIHTAAVPPAGPELTAALAAKLRDIDYDLVQFERDGDTYTVNADLVAQFATDLYTQEYGPVVDRLRDENASISRQMVEMADATTRAATEYQRRLDEVRTLPLEPVMHGMLTDAVDTAADGEAAAQAVLEIVRPWMAAQRSITNGLHERVTELDRELEEIQKSRQAWAIEALDTELSVAIPWDQLVVPATELSVGPNTAEPNGATDTTEEDPAGPVAYVVGPLIGETLVDLARIASPLKGGCPNSPGCGHPGWAHDIEDYGDPLPTCGEFNGDTECRCGHAPTGWRRVIPMRVWQPGDTVPADVFAYGGGEAVLYEAHDWVNDAGQRLVEVAPRSKPGELDTVESIVEDTAPAAEAAW